MFCIVITFGWTKNESSVPQLIWAMKKIFMKNAVKSAVALFKVRLHGVLFGHTFQCLASLFKKFVRSHVEKCS